MGGWVLVILVCVLLGAAYETLAEASDARTYRPPGRMIDVGGYHLHLHCLGTGGPTVVIDAGLGDWSTSWTRVQSRAAKTTRVCTYDRAGLGFSETGPLPRNAEQSARELHTLLRRAGLRGPYVLVGHSMGGLTVRVFAHRFPAEVAGLVLIESMSPPLPGRSTPGATPPGAAPARVFSAGSLAARLGVVRLLAGPLGLADGLPPQVARAYLALLVTPRNFQTGVDEAAGIPESLAQAGGVTTLGDLPLTVLSRGLNQGQDWQAKQTRLLRLSSRGRQVFADHSGHDVQLDQPDAAVEAIVEMVERLR